MTMTVGLKRKANRPEGIVGGTAAVPPTFQLPQRMLAKLPSSSVMPTSAGLPLALPLPLPLPLLPLLLLPPLLLLLLPLLLLLAGPSLHRHLPPFSVVPLLPRLRPHSLGTTSGRLPLPRLPTTFCAAAWRKPSRRGSRKWRPPLHWHVKPSASVPTVRSPARTLARQLAPFRSWGFGSWTKRTRRRSHPRWRN